MINKRIIPVIIIKNGIVVQSYNFNYHLPIGRPKFIVEYLSSWDCDEIVVLDISASKESKQIDLTLISELSKNISIPLTVGGGITGLDIAELYFKNGTDKVSVNSLFTSGNYKDINNISEEYGSQSTVLSLDFIEDNELQYSLYDHKNKKNLKKSVETIVDDIKNNIEIGEIFINSVNRDGSKLGYDVKLMSKFSELINKPIIAVGGADTVQHFLDILNLNHVTGLSASNVFLHSEHSVERFRSAINAQQNILRPNNYFTYE
jgi:cyclase